MKGEGLKGKGERGGKRGNFFILYFLKELFLFRGKFFFVKEVFFKRDLFN